MFQAVIQTYNKQDHSNRPTELISVTKTEFYKKNNNHLVTNGRHLRFSNGQ